MSQASDPRAAEAPDEGAAAAPVFEPASTQKPADAPILVINSGSSSLKAALFVKGATGQPSLADEQPILQATATGIGQTEGKLTIEDGEGQSLADDRHDYQSQEEALEQVARSLARQSSGKPVAIGHRVVHGGMHLTRHQRITPGVLTQLEQAVHFAPLHIPGALKLIRKCQELFPETPQFACFDTAFHQTIPEQAWRLPIDRKYVDAGVRRYGFHGLSYESIVAQLRSEPAPLPARVIVAHLGSGSSLAAIARGCSVDTSMGFTPAGGIPMATRTGDIDPGVLIYLMRSEGLSLDQAEALVNHQGGLVALSGGISDMQKLEKMAGPPQADTLQKQTGQTGAQREAVLAIAVYATAVAKTIASYIVSLGGLDLLVFTGGIGEHSAPFRSQVVRGLHALGFRLDEAANASATVKRNRGWISSPASRVSIRILPAEEDLEIARHVRRLLQ